MKRSLRRWMTGGLVAGALAIVPAGAAWACLSLAGVTTSSATVQQGGTVTVNGVEFGSNPVQIHLDSLDGPVLATVTPNSDSGGFSQAVPLPADISAGQHVLVATEPAATTNGKNNGSSTGVPARTLIDVTGPGGAAAPGAVTSSAAPTVNLTANSGAGAGTLGLIGLAAAAASLFLAGGISLVVARRRRPEPEAVKAP